MGDNMECKRCGALVKDEQKVCLKCGTLVDENLINEQTHTKRFHYTTKLGLTIMVIIIILSYICFIRIKNINTLNKITEIKKIKVDYNSPHYINDLYKSDYRHYNYLLDDIQKEIYLNLLEAIKNFESEVIIDNNKITDKYPSEYILKVYDALNMDHPELIQLKNIKTTKVTNDYRTVSITYAFNKEKLNSSINEIKNIIEKIKETTSNMNDISKAKYIYGYLSKNNTYDSNPKSINESAYDALSNKSNPVHLAYSKASQILLQNVGINSIMTIGSVNGNMYSWNLVNLDNHYYYFDVPSSNYDNPNLRYAGFLKNSRNYSYIYKSLIPKIKNK